MPYLSKLKISPDMLSLISSIDHFNGRWLVAGELVPERLSALKHVATIESVGSSTRIEGVKLNDAEVEALLSAIEIRSFHTRDEQEVAGYADAMEMIFESWESIHFSENHIQQLHSVLLSYSDNDAHHRGKYKTLPNHVEAFDKNKKSLGIVFDTISPFKTPFEMKSLIGWTNRTLDENYFHPLLVIGVFVVRFLAIHPFQDGNGRLSRVLTTLLLLRKGYYYVPYSSLEKIIEESKDNYYKSLRRGQSTLDKDESGLENWLIFFFRCLKRQTEVLESKVAYEKTQHRLSPLSTQIMALVHSLGQITIRIVVENTGANRNTVKDHVKKLILNKHLVRHGKGKGSWYTK